MQKEKKLSPLLLIYLPSIHYITVNIKSFVVKMSADTEWIKRVLPDLWGGRSNIINVRFNLRVNVTVTLELDVD